MVIEPMGAQMINRMLSVVALFAVVSYTHVFAGASVVYKYENAKLSVTCSTESSVGKILITIPQKFDRCSFTIKNSSFIESISATVNAGDQKAYNFGTGIQDIITITLKDFPCGHSKRGYMMKIGT